MIQTCRSDCRHHAANDADETKDDRGQGQAPHIDVKMDIAGLQIQGQSSHQNRFLTRRLSAPKNYSRQFLLDKQFKTKVKVT